MAPGTVYTPFIQTIWFICICLYLSPLSFFKAVNVIICPIQGVWGQMNNLSNNVSDSNLNDLWVVK